MNVYLIFYIIGWFVFGCATIEKFTVMDVGCSFVVSLAWPILMLIRVAKRIIK